MGAAEIAPADGDVVNAPGSSAKIAALWQRSPRGHGQFLGKLRLDRGPLRWWLMVVGLVTVEYGTWRFALGTVLVVFGAVLHVISNGYLRPGRKFLKRTRALTTRGPYRFVRNPFYLANLLAEVGLLVIIGRLWVALLYLSIWAWVYSKSILQEERRLLAICGDFYAEYCRKVPRLFPRPWRIWPRAQLSGPRFSWSNPHIADGKEIQRAVRLVSYPLLLQAVAGIHRADWSLTSFDPFILLFAASFVSVNGIGWLTSTILQRVSRRGDLAQDTIGARV